MAAKGENYENNDESLDDFLVDSHTLKRCTKCREIKQVSQFHKQKTGKNGLHSQCKVCKLKTSAEWDKANSSRRSVTHKNWLLSRPDYHQKRREYNKSYLKSYGKQYYLMSKYGMTIDDYEVMLVRQDGRCAICNSSEPHTQNGKFCIDHDHKSEVVRSLLCNKCNTAIGLLNENTETLKSAIVYINKYGGDHE